MSLEDPQYGALYYQAVSKDPSGLAATCIMRKPKQVTRELPPHQYLIPQGQPTYPKGVLPRQPGMQMPSKCFGCFEIGHSLRDCPKMAQLINQGVVTLDPHNFKYRFPDGQPLIRRQDESLMDTVNRMRPPQRSVQFATIGDSVKNFYIKSSKKSYLQTSYSESEYETSEYETESEEEQDEEFDRGHWKWRSQHQKEFPSYTAYEAYDEEDDEPDFKVYPAERMDKGRTTRQAREDAMRNPIKKAQLDGVYMPPRRSTRSTEKLPETIPSPSKPIESSKSLPKQTTSIRSKENIHPLIPEPIPIDARKARFKENTDITMEEPGPTRTKPVQEEKKQITLQDYSNKPKPMQDKNFEPSSDRTRTGPRQSELSTQINSKDVVEQILDTQVSLPLRKILGASKELSNNFQEVIRYKNPNMKPPVTAAVQKVLNSNIPSQEEEIEEISNKHHHEPPEGRMLIQLTLYCRNKPITAIIDTGSQLNVV